MAFYLDDVPAEPFVIEPPDTIDLAEFTAASAELVAPDAIITDLVAAIDDPTNTIIVTQPVASAFTVEGIHLLRITLTGAPAVQRLPDVRIVVQDPDSEWHTLDTARHEWADAEHLPDATLYQLLEDVREQVLDFAPALAVDATVPPRYKRGQLMQARNSWNAARVDPATGGDGEETFIIRPFPLDWSIKQVLRPRRGIPVVA